MNPVQTFGGAAAPSNMQFPTAAYLQSSQNAADMQYRGMEAMGKGIAQGISGAVGGYMKYKDIKADVAGAEKGYNVMRSFLPPEKVAEIDSQIQSMENDPNVSLSTKKQFWDQTNSILGAAIKQSMDMQRDAASNAAAAARQASQISATQLQPYIDQAAKLMNQPFDYTNKNAGFGGGKAPGSVSLKGDQQFSFGGHL